MIFLALQTFSKKRQEPSSCAPAVGSALTVFVQSAGVFKFAKFLFCLGGQMVRDIDLDRHVLIAMDGFFMETMPFPFNLILVPDCVPAAILHRTLPYRVETSASPPKTAVVNGMRTVE